jgi:hypothetical protein
MKSSILIKHTATGAITEVTEAAWQMMKLDGRSRKYSVVPSGAKPYFDSKPEKEEILIKPVFTKRTKAEVKPEIKTETNEGTD